MFTRTKAVLIMSLMFLFTVQSGISLLYIFTAAYHVGHVMQMRSTSTRLIHVNCTTPPPPRHARGGVEVLPCRSYIGMTSMCRTKGTCLEMNHRLCYQSEIKYGSLIRQSASFYFRLCKRSERKKPLKI